MRMGDVKSEIAVRGIIAMKTHAIGTLVAAGLAGGLFNALAAAQTADTIEAHIAAVGEKEYSTWAVTTSEGIILVDAIWDYSVADEVVGGLKKLPAVRRDITVDRTELAYTT
jgi:hypothetical protein